MLLRIIFIIVLIVMIFIGTFYYGAASHLDHAHANRVATYIGFLSSLAWGLGVAGYLLWLRLGLINNVIWNSWFNFVAADMAALALGYGTI